MPVPDAEGISVIDAFLAEFTNREEGAQLSRYFRSDDITRRSSNEEVVAYLQQQADDAITGAIEVIRNRVDRFGVTEPSIQTQGSRRIVVELPGIDDPERVRRLLRGTALLEFRLMVDPAELNTSLQRMIDYFEVDVAAAPGGHGRGPYGYRRKHYPPWRSDDFDSAGEPLAAQEDSADADSDSTFDVSELLEGMDDMEGSMNRLLDVLRPVAPGDGGPWRSRRVGHSPVQRADAGCRSAGHVAP